MKKFSVYLLLTLSSIMLASHSQSFSMDENNDREEIPDRKGKKRTIFKNIEHENNGEDFDENDDESMEEALRKSAISHKRELNGREGSADNPGGRSYENKRKGEDYTGELEWALLKLPNDIIAHLLS